MVRGTQGDYRHPDHLSIPHLQDGRLLVRANQVATSLTAEILIVTAGTNQPIAPGIGMMMLLHHQLDVMERGEDMTPVHRDGEKLLADPQENLASARYISFE